MKKLYQDTSFYLVAFILSYFIYVYPYEILNEFLFNERPNRRSSLLTSLFISVLIIFYFRTKNTFLPLKFFIYEGMGIGFISFIIVNFFLIISFFLLIDKYFLGILSLILISIFLLIGFIYGHKIFLKEINISSNKVNKNYKFIFISDIHLGSNSIKHFHKILNKIKKIEYNFILIGGDLIDSSSFDIDKLLILKDIKKPIYFVTGNHEYYLENYLEKLMHLSKLGIKILDNKNIIIDELNIIGISDNQSPSQQSNNYINLIIKTKYNLLLVHKPSIWDNIKDKVDLMLSGHCHNGQIIPFNIFVKLQFKFIYGLYISKNSKLYVTSGSGCWGPRLRVGSKNEIIYIKLKPNSKLL